MEILMQMGGECPFKHSVSRMSSSKVQWYYNAKYNEWYYHLILLDDYRHYLGENKYIFNYSTEASAHPVFLHHIPKLTALISVKYCEVKHQQF